MSPHQPALTPVTPSTAPIKAKLSKLSLNKFSCNPVDWQVFWDSFDSAVGSNSSLSDVDKFNYLKSLLHGSAAEIKIPEEFIIIITRDLPSAEWKIETPLNIFNTELQLREKCALVSGTGQRKEQHFSPRDKGKYINHYQSPTAALLTENKSVQSREGPWCTFCNGNHLSSNCTIVTDISARKQILRRRGKCFKCLQTGHLFRYCKSENHVITVVIIIIHPYVKSIVSLNTPPPPHNQLTQTYHNKGILHLYTYVHQQTCLYINPILHVVIPVAHMFQMPLPSHLHHNRQMFHPATHLYQPIQQQT